MVKKYKIKSLRKYQEGGEEKKEVSPKKEKPVFDPAMWNPNNLEYTKGFEPDPVKWNKFHTWLTQKKINGKPAAGNTDLDNKDTKKSQVLIDEWNKLNPDKPITTDDIKYAQDWYIRQGNPINESQTTTTARTPDLWLGSKTSQIKFPIKQGKYTDYTKAQKDPTAIFNKTIQVVDKVGDIPYAYSVKYNQSGTPEVLSGYNKFYGELPKTLFPEQKFYQQPQTIDTINLMPKLTPEEIKQKLKNVPSTEIKEFAGGGKAGNFFHNFGTAIADTALGAIGAGDVLNEGDYRGKRAEQWGNVTDVTGQIAGAVAPMAMNAMIPGSGKFVSMGQQIIGANLNKAYGPQEEENQIMYAKHGGMMPNAELEKKEVMQYPDGTTGQVNGPSHENGGVPVNIPAGTKVFSDRLKASNGKTFAKEAAKLKTDKEERIIEDKKTDRLAKATAQLMLDAKNKKLNQLFMEQEMKKESMHRKQLEDDFMACGGMVKMQNGGIYIKPQNRGKFTAAAKRAGMGVQEYASHILANKENYSSTLVKRANFARNASKWKHEYGGMHMMPDGTMMLNSMMPKYSDRAVHDPEGKERDAWMKWQSQNWDPEVMDYQTALNTFRQQQSDLNSNFANKEQMQKFELTPIVEKDAPFNPQLANQLRLPDNQKSPDSFNQNKFTDALGFAAGAAVQNIGNIAYLAQQGKKYDTQKFYEYTPKTLSSQEAMRQADLEGKIAAQNIRTASGGSPGTYLSNRVALGSGISKAKGQIQENFENLNTQIQNQAAQLNLANKYNVDDINARNKAAALNQYYGTLNALGQSAAGAFKDYRATSMDRSKINMLPKIYDIYKNNPELAELIMSWTK